MTTPRTRAMNISIIKSRNVYDMAKIEAMTDSQLDAIAEQIFREDSAKVSIHLVELEKDGNHATQS